MRKTLLRTLLAAFCAIPFALRSLGEGWVAAHPLEGGGVMLIAARNSFMTGGWKNPYVTDGLVAMWDGEWNAGGGKHDNTNRITEILSGTTFTDQYLTNKGGFFRAEVPDGIQHMVDLRVDVAHLSYLTIESVFAVTKYSPNHQSRSLMITSPYLGLDLEGDASTVTIISYRGTERIVSSTRPIVGVKTRFVGAFSNSSTDFCYINDRYYTEFRLYWSDPRSLGSRIIVRVGAFTAGAGGAGCDIYCVRAYNKQLTADEIAANYAVDKARFNLP